MNAAPPGKALVTGGAGFIGSHLCELLVEGGWEVFCLDNLSTGSAENMAQLEAHPRFHLLVDSVLSPAIVNELVQKCDVVYHLAAAVGVRLAPSIEKIRARIGWKPDDRILVDVISAMCQGQSHPPTPKPLETGSATGATY